MSKAITPSNLGETIKLPTRSLIVLKAWMLWRARQHPAWLGNSGSRQRLFLEEADQLRLELKRLQPQSDGLLGNAAGSSLLRQWVPDLVAELKLGGCALVPDSAAKLKLSPTPVAIKPAPATCGKSSSSGTSTLPQIA